MLASVAKRLGISTQLLEQIYAEHAEVLEQRVLRAALAKEQEKQAKQAAVLARCGALPKSAWREVRDYMNALAERRGVRVRMGECLTPRLSDKTCWSVVCDFEEVASSRESFEDRVTKHTWSFRMQGDRVLDHHAQ